MSDEQVDLPSSDNSVETSTPSVSDIASNAIDIAFQREADRAAGKSVPDALPEVARTRDEQGKFVPKTKASVPAVTQSSQPVTVTASAQPSASPVASATQALPVDWNDAQKASFAAIPADHQKFILEQRQRQDADYTRKTQEVAEQRKTYEPVMQAIAPHVDYLNTVSRQLGQTAPAMLSNLVQFERTLRTSAPEQRAAALAQLIREYPVTLDQLNRALGQPQAQIPDAYANQLRQTQSQLQAVQDRLSQQDTEREHQAAVAQVQNAATAKDETGNLKYPHFDAVRAVMGPLVLQGRDFDDAYKIAAGPLERFTAQQNGGTADKARATAVARAKAAGSPRTAGTTPGGSLSASSMDQRVSNILDSVGIV